MPRDLVKEPNRDHGVITFTSFDNFSPRKGILQAAASADLTFHSLM